MGDAAGAAVCDQKVPAGHYSGQDKAARSSCRCGHDRQCVRGADEIFVLLAAGLAALALHSRGTGACGVAAPLLFAQGVTAALPLSLGALSLFLLKVVSVLFGSGYVLIAFLRADLVARRHWQVATGF